MKSTFLLCALVSWWFNAAAQTNLPTMPTLMTNQLASFTNTHHLATNVVWAPNVTNKHVLLAWNMRGYVPDTNTVLVVQRTRDLVNWQDAAQLNPTATEYTNTVPANEPRYFYRVVVWAYDVTNVSVSTNR